MFEDRVHLQGGGGDLTARREEALRKARQEARKGNFESTDDMYRYLSEFADPNYREESYRDIDFQGYHKNLGKESLAYKDADAYKAAILRAGDPRGMFTGNITDPRYGTPEEVAKSQRYLSHFNRHTSALGFDPAGMAQGVAPTRIMTTLPGVTPINPINTTPVQPQGVQTGPFNVATNSYPTDPNMTQQNMAQQTGVARQGGYQPFMNLDEARAYYGGYGGYAHGGPVALRRKMFSMGGDVDKSHGVGLTSGLTKKQGYKSGGHVLPKGFVPQRVGYQPSAFHQNGREGHSGFIINALKGLGSFVAPGVRTFLRGSKALTKGGFGDYVKFGKTGLKTIQQRQAELKAAQAAAKAAREADEAAKAAVKKAGKKGKDDAAAAAKAAADAKKAAFANRRELLKQFGRDGRKGLGTGIMALPGQIGRTAAIGAVPAAYLAGSMPSSIIPTKELDDDSSVLDYLVAGGQQLSRLPMQALLSSYDMATGKPSDLIDNLRGFGPASSSYYGYEKPEEAPGIDTTKLEPAQFATAEELQDQMQEEYRQKIEFYKELLGAETKEDNLGLFAKTMFEGAEALDSGEGFGGALKNINRALSDEVSARAASDQDINTAAVNQAFADITGSDQMLQQANLQALAGGDNTFLQRAIVQEEAQEQGVPGIEPFIGDDGEIDTDELSKKLGQIFVDLSQASGGYYVAVDMDGNIEAFNSLERAKQHINGIVT
tara:strand:- start:6916 stop:9066 length:2151 start_codon:yes stop_codon:yes gene_type:complete